MSTLAAALVLFCCSATVTGCRGRGVASSPTADPDPALVTRVFIGGSIRTLDPAQPRVESLVARGGRIVYLGDTPGAMAYADQGSIVTDLDGDSVLPGFIDAHAHFLGLGRVLDTLDLSGAGSLDRVRELTGQACAAAPTGSWVYGRGWDETTWDEPVLPSWRDLDICPDHPVYLSRVDGHAWWVNRRAMERADISAATPDPDGGRLMRDAGGEPTGILLDNAKLLVSDRLPGATREQTERWALRAQRECLAMGLTGFGDAGVPGSTLDLFDELGAAGKLQIRIYAMLGQDETLLQQRLQQGPQIGLHDHHYTARCVKLYADGALGSRGAALLEPYADEPGWRGQLVSEPQRLEELTCRALDAGFQVATHAIGDHGVRVILDAYEKATETRSGDLRLRVEHAQIVHALDLPRFAGLGVIPSMQPTHATSDMDWVQDRLGTGRLDGSYAWRSFVDGGVRVPMGSDAPVESADPLWGIYAAVTRQDHRGLPAGGWLPDQRLSMEQAVRGFTIDAAYAQYQEELLGTLEEGKLADFVVLSEDLFEIEPAAILETEVLMTVVGGEIVYQGP